MICSTWNILGIYNYTKSVLFLYNKQDSTLYFILEFIHSIGKQKKQPLNVCGAIPFNVLIAIYVVSSSCEDKLLLFHSSSPSSIRFSNSLRFCHSILLA